MYRSDRSNLRNGCFVADTLLGERQHDSHQPTSPKRKRVGQSWHVRTRLRFGLVLVRTILPPAIAPSDTSLQHLQRSLANASDCEKNPSPIVNRLIYRLVLGSGEYMLESQASGSLQVTPLRFELVLGKFYERVDYDSTIHRHLEIAASVYTG